MRTAAAAASVLGRTGRRAAAPAGGGRARATGRRAEGVGRFADDGRSCGSDSAAGRRGFAVATRAARGGGATPEGTAALASRFPEMPYAGVPKTGWTVSRVGFGAYRVRAGNATHAAAVRCAVENGINVFDTAGHFEGGASETLVGAALRDAFSDGSVKREVWVFPPISPSAFPSKFLILPRSYRDPPGHFAVRPRHKEVVVVTKGGFLDAEIRSTLDASDYVTLGDGKAAHGIGPAALERQLQRSLAKMDLGPIDLFLINNPERMLQADGKGYTMATLQRDLTSSFAYLERERQAGRIGGFGVCSNSIVTPSAPDHLPFEGGIMSAVEAACAEAGFAAVEAPANMFENEAVKSRGELLACSSRRRGVFFFAHRLLNVIDGGQVRTLAGGGSERPDEGDSMVGRATEYFQAVAGLESRLADEVSIEDMRRANVLSKFVWAEVIGDNLSRLSANHFAAKHFFNGHVLPKLRSDLAELAAFAAETEKARDSIHDCNGRGLPAGEVSDGRHIPVVTRPRVCGEGGCEPTEVRESFSGEDGASAMDLREWMERYEKAMIALCDSLLSISAEDEARRNSDLASVLDLVAPSLRSSPSLPAKAIRVALSHPEVGCALVGARRPEYVRCAIEAAARPPLSLEELERVYSCPLL